MGKYAPRLFEPREAFSHAGIRFKFCTIAAAGRENIATRPIVEAAKRAVEASGVPALDHRGLGYVIYHAGEQANWLLTRVWLNGDIVSGLLGRIVDGAYVDVSEPLVECVWEEIAVHHERDAWVRHMMSGLENPDAYMAETIAVGMH
ncbi:MAG: hypothetical protein Rhirs2KO_20210 [Rhizobiaceae bacterium]|jgi:hypothetical protein